MIWAPLVEPCDIQQEYELRKLRGINPNKGIIALELNRKATKDPSLPEHVVAVSPIEDEDSTHADLLAWASSQDPRIQDLIHNFLEEPDCRYDETIQALLNSGIELEVDRPVRTKTKVTYKSILKRALPATQDDLIQALQTCPINRPASTVRQFLRRHKDHLVKDVYGRWHWKHRILGER